MMEELNNIKNKNPFNVPENYFEEVNQKIISAASGTQPGSNRKGTIRRLSLILAVAASVAVFVLLGYRAMKIFLPDKEINLTEISMDEFPGSDLYDIDILTLEQNADPSFLEKEASGLSNDEIIDILLVENIDINEIYKRL